MARETHDNARLRRTASTRTTKLVGDLTTAGLRAARAWSVRREQPEAWREVSRMHGAFLSLLPPGVGPTTPGDLIKALHIPMRQWVPLTWDGLPDELGSFTILGKDGLLTGDAIEYGSDYSEALFENHEAGIDWVPRWAQQTFEKVERSVYTVLSSAGQEEYVATRQMLIEVPAGTAEFVSDELHERGALHTEAYEPLPPDRQFVVGRDSWYVPCPACNWPMHVQGSGLACRYPQHSGLFRVTDEVDGTGAPRVDGPKPVHALSATEAVCVHEAIWRYITVPGVTEVELMTWLAEQPGIGASGVAKWPHKDRWDITVRTGGDVFEIDLKDTRSPSQVAARPPRARHVVVPDYRAWQVAQLRRSLPAGRYEVRTVRAFKTVIRSALKEGR
ncbi:restriction endonuclease-related protein [Kitasatospora cineracea]|uniref:restriction endonuclease-related protein n=1 Tax=Kitasatospora cineracea TaxID=88074 RepID=UPI0036CE703D